MVDISLFPKTKADKEIHGQAKRVCVFFATFVLQITSVKSTLNKDNFGYSQYY